MSSVTDETASAPYTSLAEVYDDWMSDTPYDNWVDFIESLVQDSPDIDLPSRVLDLCCGTGQVASRLALRGWDITAVDRSEQMLTRARRNFVGHDVTLLNHDLSSGTIPVAPQSFQLATCAYDSINYFQPGGQVKNLLAIASHALREGGLLIFDMNTEKKLRDVFGNSHSGDDKGAYAYIWRNRLVLEESRVDFNITLFRHMPSGWERSTEHHSQWWHRPTALEATAREVGLELIYRSQDYSAQPVSEKAMRETWVLKKRPF